MAKAPRVTAASILVFLFALIVYRAVTQSITHDEALTYRFYMATPLSYIFKLNDPNNHLLVVLLMRLSTSLFGISELTMRLPSVLFAGLYFYTVYRLCILLFGGGWLLVICVALLTANPLLLDFLVAARGYGPATTLLFYGVYCLLLYRTANRYQWGLLYRGAAGMSLGVMSNLAVLFPAFVATALFLASLNPAPPVKRDKRSRKPVIPPPTRLAEATRLLAPVFVLAVVFLLATPVKASSANRFYTLHFGLLGSLESLVNSSFAHNEGLGGLNRDNHWLVLWRKLLAFGALPAVVIAGIIVSVRARPVSGRHLALLWSSGIVFGSFVLHAIGHAVMSIPYPADRTGLHFFPFVGLTLGLLAAEFLDAPGRMRLAAVPLAALAVVLALQYIVQLNWTHFYMWAYDSESRRIIKRLESFRPPSRAAMDVGLSWQLLPSFCFYRETGKLWWLKPVFKEEQLREHDYYLLLPQDRHLIAERRLKVLYEAPRSGVTIAATETMGSTRRQ